MPGSTARLPHESARPLCYPLGMSRRLATVAVVCSLVGTAFIGSAVVGSVTGCVTAAQVRSVTYPASFQYIPQERLTDSMWRLARGVQDLDDTFGASTELADADRQTRVLAILDDMSAATAAVSAPGQNTNHPTIELNLDRLQVDIALARSAAAQTPVDFAPARQLPTACLSCHVGGPGGPQRH